MTRSAIGLSVVALAGVLLAPSLSFAQVVVEKPTPNTADEPLAEKLSLDKAGEFLDAASVTWTRERKCGTCHTNFMYMIARPALDKNSAAMREVREFFEGRAANWDTAKPRSTGEVVGTAASLAINDARTTGKLHPLTLKAFERTWALQRADGIWDWPKCDWPPLEHDDYFGALYAAVGLGMAPDGYANSPGAQEGRKRLRAFFQQNKPPDLHHAAWLLWASTYLKDFMELADRQKTIEGLLARQHPDGGWSLASLGEYKRKDGSPNDPEKCPSDGYGTGLVLFILHEAGVPKSQKIDRGLAWLAANQRASGRWFTRSLTNDRAHYITNVGSAFAVLGVQSWREGQAAAP